MYVLLQAMCVMCGCLCVYMYTHNHTYILTYTRSLSPQGPLPALQSADKFGGSCLPANLDVRVCVCVCIHADTYTRTHTYFMYITQP